MIIPVKRQIFQIFSPDGNIKYYVPKYQREYMWSLKHWEQLLEDLLDNNAGYFLGPILCISRENDAFKQPKPLEIIDGQQRFATVSLIYAAIYNRYLKENKIDDMEFNLEKINLSYRLIQKASEIKGQLKLELSTTKENLSDYKWILYELGIYKKGSYKRPSNIGNRRLYKAYKYFEREILDIESFKKVEDLLSKVNQAWVVMIQVENHSDAFMLFESLNDRGMPLSAMDIIKNKIFAEIEKKTKGSMNITNKKWKYILENLEDYRTQERFLRQFYNAFKFKENIKVKIKGISKAIRSNVIKIYNELIKADPEFLLQEFIDKSKIYNQFINLENEETPSELQPKFKDLLNIGGIPSRILLLYLFSEHSSNIELIKDTLDFLIKYFVRRNLTDYPGTRKLDQIFIDTIQECEIHKKTLNSKIIIEFLTQSDKFSSLEKFLEELKGDIYKTNTQVARFILSKIEEKYFTKENFKDLWEKSGKKLVWSIEHILPKGKSLKVSWIKMIADGDRIKAEELQKRYVHKLGNLTLTGYNPNLSNSEFVIKKEKKDKKGNYIGFRNNLYLNEYLAKKEGWTIEDIKIRTEKLVNETTELFEIKK